MGLFCGLEEARESLSREDRRTRVGHNGSQTRGCENVFRARSSAIASPVRTFDFYLAKLTLKDEASHGRIHKFERS